MEQKSTEILYDLIVVGAGASGMMAAGRAAERGLRVLVLEKNKRVGEKLRISGGGRCNILNAEEDVRVLLKKYGKAEQPLYSLFSQFGVKETTAFFTSRGLSLVVENAKRAFPSTHKAEDVVSVLVKYMEKGGVTIRYSVPVTKVTMKDGIITGLLSGKEEFFAKEYIFATGSVSHPETGSTGDGFKWLTALGHTVAEPTPTIVPLAVKEKWVKELAGVSLDGMKITFFVDGVKSFSLTGKVLFTHFGISGPLILNNAHKVADLLHTGEVTATIDAAMQSDFPILEKAIVSVFDANKNKTLKNVVKEFVFNGMQKGVTTILEEYMDVDTKVHSVTKEERKKIVHLLKALPLTIEGLMGFDRAVVADGGVPLEEIDMKTMRSKKVANLLVTGDLLHINRPSGGYSLQLCWTTGWVAADSASSRITSILAKNDAGINK
jgi:predicted Rossmann fold flavoprotein